MVMLYFMMLINSSWFIHSSTNLH